MKFLLWLWQIISRRDVSSEWLRHYERWESSRGIDQVCAQWPWKGWKSNANPRTTAKD